MSEAAVESNVFVAEFAKALPRLARKGPDWLHRLRKEALGRFESLGFPTSRDEEWKQTSVLPITRTAFRLARLDSVVPGEVRVPPLADLACPRLVFLNGMYVDSLSEVDGLPVGVRAMSLAIALASVPDEVEPHLARYAPYANRAFSALNTAFVEDGAFVVVPPGTVSGPPIHIVNLTVPGTDSVVSHPRTLVVIGEGSQVSLIESYLALGEAVYLTNAVTELVIGENAAVDHCRIQAESPLAYHVGAFQAHQARASRLASLNVCFGSALARGDLGATLDGEGADCLLHGLYLVDGARHVDNHTTLDHARPNCTSYELYKGILSGRARAVFNGRIIVRPDAQKTDSKQSNRNLLLSDEALVFTRPQLEIYANDVRCTHGATIGQMDADAMFYMQSRAIGPEDARRMLLHAFASDVLGRVKHPGLRSQLETELETRLPQALGPS